MVTKQQKVTPIKTDEVKPSQIIFEPDKFSSFWKDEAVIEVISSFKYQ